MSLLFFSVTLTMLAASEPAPPAEMVTVTLAEYQSLYRRATLHEERLELEAQRRELQAQFEAKALALEDERRRAADLVARRFSRTQVLPGNWLLLNQSVAGTYCTGDLSLERNLAEFDFVLDLRIFDDAWTSIPLVDAQSITTGWEVSRKQGDSLQESSGDGWSFVDVGSEVLLVLGMSIKDKAGEVRVEERTLVTNISGTYRVRFRAYYPVQVTRAFSSLSLTSLYPVSSAWLRLKHCGMGKNVHEFSVEPAASYDVTEDANHTDVYLRLPATKLLKLKWQTANAPSIARSRDGASPFGGHPEAVAQELQPHAIVHQESLHSVSESVLQSESTFKFSYDSEQAFQDLEIHVYGGARVTGVVAHGMQTWHATSTGNGTLVRVQFKSSTMAKDAIIVLSTELEFGSEGGHVELPLMVCNNVLRQTGTIAIVKVASVEVHEHAAHGAARIGSGEVSTYVRGRTGRPIVLAYKFLSPRHSIVISVVRHEEIQTLPSVIDSALYEVLVTDTQKMHTLTLVLQNTQQQYMVIHGISVDATFWTLRINSLPTQPVRGQDGVLMVPLLVGTGGELDIAGLAPRTSMELSWMSKHNSLGDKGTIDLSPPRVGMPIAALSVQVQIPELYDINFTGTLQNVSIFSHKLPHSVNYETDRHIVEQGFKFGAHPPPEHAKVAGIKASIPKQGQRYRFEKILVVDDEAALHASYGLKPRILPPARNLWAYLWWHRST